jgi:tetratricopeptide (TPR) repeat protein
MSIYYRKDRAGIQARSLLLPHKLSFFILFLIPIHQIKEMSNQLSGVCLSLLLLGLLATMACNHQNHNSIPKLEVKDASGGGSAESENIKKTYDKAIADLKDKPDDFKPYITLASVFITEGRLSGDYSYNSNAAIQMLNRVLDSTTDNDLRFQALSLKSAVLLNMHQFKDALDAANEGVKLAPYNSGIYGALVDANVEMGNYKEAVADCDKMNSIRPDLRSYSRASYLRQIYGYNRAAISAMDMAVQAGAPGAENTEWARVTLGDLYLYTGNADSALYQYQSSLYYRPGYPFALMGMAKALAAKRLYDSAIGYTRQAIKVRSEAAFVSYLGDLYELKGDSADAKDARNTVVDQLEANKKNEPADAGVKHNANRELAMAYMNAGKMDKAMEYAINDLQMRPDNIDANELVAWLYYLKGDYTNAKVHADKMLATNVKNATTLYKAAIIYGAAGDATKCKQLKQAALAISPYIDPRIINRSPDTALTAQQGKI